MKVIVYLGFNNPFIFKRGVENVIYFQHMNDVFDRSIYIFFGEKNVIFKWDDIICISIKNDIMKFLRLNTIIFYLKRKYKSVFIHSHNIVMSDLLCYKTNLLTVHDAIYYQRKSNNDKKALLFIFVELLSLFKCKNFHFISQYTLSKSLIRNLTNHKFIINNTCTYEKINICSETVYKENEFRIFTVRGIQKRTRVDLLIEFARFVKDKKINGQKIHIYVAGKGPLLENYKNKIRKLNLNNITLLGYISDQTVANYYSNCNYVILPCEYAEGFGLPIIEGYYYNKPVIASNKCAIPEIIINNQYLFENNVTSIWETLNKTLSLVYDFKSYYNIRFSNKVILTKYEKLYKNILDNNIN